MTDAVKFETWISTNFLGGGRLDGSRQSRSLQEMMADAVTAPEVTIMSRAVAETGVDEIQARMTLALVYAFQNSDSGTLDRHA